MLSTIALKEAIMGEKTFLILGGYGNTGRQISRLLLQETGARLVLAGRTIEDADAAAAQLNTFSKPPYGTALKVEARGEKESRDKAVNVSIYHEDAYMLTAIPVVACLLQYLDGSLRKPGLWTQANIVEPNRLITDIKRLSVDVHVAGDISGGK